jgi:hypothetical protein
VWKDCTESDAEKLKDYNPKRYRVAVSGNQKSISEQFDLYFNDHWLLAFASSMYFIGR